MSGSTGVRGGPPKEWTLRLAAAPDVALASLRKVSTQRVWVVRSVGSRVVLSYGGREPAVRVSAEVHPREGGCEVRVRRAGTINSREGVLATILGVFCFLAGPDIARVEPRGWLIAFWGALGLALLIWMRIYARTQRNADVLAIAEAIDRTLAPLKPGDQGTFYRAPSGAEPERASEPEYGAGSRRGRNRRRVGL